MPNLGVFVMETYYSEGEGKNPGSFSSKGKLAESSPKSPYQKPQVPDTLTKSLDSQEPPYLFSLFTSLGPQKRYCRYMTLNVMSTNCSYSKSIP